MRLIDTNICIAILRGSSPRMRSRFLASMPDGVAVSSVTAAELYTGVAKSADPAREGRNVADLIGAMSILSFDLRAAQAYGFVRSYLERRGALIGPLDLMIAAQSLAENAVIVTNNAREFTRVPHLEVETWA